MVEGLGNKKFSGMEICGYKESTEQNLHLSVSPNPVKREEVPKNCFPFYQACKGYF